MNSWDKHIPKLVFIFGFFLLAAAVSVFLTPKSDSFSKTDSSPAPLVELSGTVRQRISERPWLSPSPVAEPGGRQKAPEPDGKGVFAAHVKSVGLSMRQPEKMAFAQTRARGLNVLVGTGQTGQPEFILFSNRGKLKQEKTKATLEEQFRSQGLKAKEVTSMNSRGGLGAMTVVKGRINDSDEFQAFAFHAEKANVSHILVLIGPELSRHPASVRQVVDSISAIR
ncbi:MAG: hypothetical protein AB7H97_22410 [Pseudobdellovibrionaceae bacterium]